MTNDERTSGATLSLRLSADERARLERAAAGRSLSAYVRARLFGDGAALRSRGKFPVKDHRALAQALALLGRSALAQSLQTMADAARNGVLPVSPDTEALLQQAAREVREIKSLLMRALGLKER